jgi:hypothetical protein
LGKPTRKPHANTWRPVWPAYVRKPQLRMPEGVSVLPAAPSQCNTRMGLQSATTAGKIVQAGSHNDTQEVNTDRSRINVLGTRRGASKHDMKWMYMRCRGGPDTPSVGSKVKECHGVNADVVQRPGQLPGLHQMHTAVAIGATSHRNTWDSGP